MYYYFFSIDGRGSNDNNKQNNKNNSTFSLQEILAVLPTTTTTTIIIINNNNTLANVAIEVIATEVLALVANGKTQHMVTIVDPKVLVMLQKNKDPESRIKLPLHLKMILKY